VSCRTYVIDGFLDLFRPAIYNIESRQEMKENYQELELPDDVTANG